VGPRAPQAGAASLRPFFRPRSVAVIGASRDPSGIGQRLLRCVEQGGFQGPIYPINPHASTVAGLRAYPSVRDVPGPVDLALIAVPRDAVLGVVDECGARGVPAVAVVTAGFAEVGPKGQDLQRQLLDRARRYGIRLLGPNSLGLVSTGPDVRLNATFVPVFPPPGRVAMSSDSGGLALALLAGAARLGLGISSCASVGNRADVSSTDLLEYWEQDEQTGVVLLYLESFGDPRRFARAARRISSRKPLVVLKAGRGPAGHRAAASHTAALVASDVALGALLHQTGALRADGLEELLDLAVALDAQPLPAGRRVAVLTNAGGPAILCADACEAAGLTLPELSVQTQGLLAAFLPPTASLANPVDLIATATPEQFRRAIPLVLASGEVDALVLLYMAPAPHEVEAVTRGMIEGLAVARQVAPAPVPVLACLMPDPGAPSLDVGVRERVPCYAFPEAPARALGKAAAYAEWRRQPPGKAPHFADFDLPAARAVCAEALAGSGPGWLTACQTRRLLQAAGLPLAPGGVATSADEAAALAREVGFPVALKLASHRLVHKTEVGGVRLGVADEAEARRAFEEISARITRDWGPGALEGVLVQPMASGGIEVLVGLTQDELFGPLVAFGLGGTFVEALGDICFRVAPLTDRDAAEMVRSVRARRLFAGYRGHPPADVPALEEVLLRVSHLAEMVPEVNELDLNPLFALPPGQGCRIADARARVGHAPAPA
jgi:acyl-CoA synthetase (NDP forming)